MAIELDACRIQNFPNEICWAIAANLKITSKDFKSLKATCKKWHQICSNADFLSYKLRYSMEVHFSEIIDVKKKFDRDGFSCNVYSLIGRCANLKQLDFTDVNENFDFDEVFKVLPLSCRGLCIDACLNAQSLNSLESVDALPSHIEALAISKTNFETVSLKNCENLRFLRLNFNQKLKRANLEKIPNLTELDLSDCGSLYSLQVLSVNGLKKLNLDRCLSLPKLSMQRFKYLEELRLSGCKLAGQLSLENLPSLKKLVLQPIAIACLSLSNLPKLESLESNNCSYLSQAVLRYLPSLKQIDLKLAINLQSLLINKLPALERVSIEHAHSFTSAGSLVLRGVPALKELFFEDFTKLKQLDLRACSGLNSLKLRKCQQLKKIKLTSARELESILVKECAKLRKISIHWRCRLKKIDLQAMNRTQKWRIWMQLMPGAIMTL